MTMTMTVMMLMLMKAAAKADSQLLTCVPPPAAPCPCPGSCSASASSDPTQLLLLQQPLPRCARSVLPLGTRERAVLGLQDNRFHILGTPNANSKEVAMSGAVLC